MASLFVVGPPKAGKTTILNALVGRPLFPYVPGKSGSDLRVTVCGAVDSDLQVLADGNTFSVSCDDDPSQTCVVSGPTGIARVGSLDGDDAVASASSVLVQPVTRVEGAVPIVECTVGGAELPAESTVICVVPADAAATASRPQELGLELSVINALRQQGFLVVNATDRKRSADADDDLRARASTIAGVDASRVAVIDARMALAAATVPDGAFPLPAALAALRKWTTSALCRLTSPSASGTRHRVETAGRLPRSDEGEAGKPDRYIPKHMTHKVEPMDDVLPKKPVDPSETASADRYTPKAVHSPAVAAAILSELDSYVPKSSSSSA